VNLAQPSPYSERVRLQEPRRELPSWLWFLIAIVAGGAIGLFVLRPLLAGNGGDAATPDAEPSARCADPAGGTLALTEYVRPSMEAGSVAYTRDYRLERPAQAPVGFEGGGDNNQEPLDCGKVRFGPGPRVDFGRGPEAFTIEYVGPTVNRFQAANHQELVKFALDPRWQGRLNLADYEATAPALDSNGRGRLVLTPRAVASGLPPQIVLSTVNGGVTYKLDEQASSAGLR
jgi:hypothetical protein